MKRQIRQSVFETNSSTQHSLCIKKNSNLKNVIDSIKAENNVITVPSIDDKSWYETIAYKDVVEISKLSFIEKMNVLVASTLANYDRDGFLESLSMIQKTLSDIGLEIVIDFGKFSNLNSNYYWSDGLYESINDMLNSETLLDFLFSEDCVHTSFCDECCGEPTEEIEAVWERFDNMSKEDKIVFTDRR